MIGRRQTNSRDKMLSKEFLKKHAILTGQLVKITDGEKNFTGYVLPGSERDNKIIRLKLKSGYNVGIKTSENFHVEKLGEEKMVGKQKKTHPKQDLTLPKIAILHTGGTIASRVNYSIGGVIASFDSDDLLTMFPELTGIAQIDSIFVANIMSEDMRLADYKKISNSVAEQIKKGVKGVIIGHGTDMLGYSAAALAFELENCPIPVLIVGAQRSSDRGSSDAAMNLICAASFIAKTDFKGVAVCMHNSGEDTDCAIISAVRVRKMHTSRRDAFKPINDTPIAIVDYTTKEIKWIKEKADYEIATGEFRLFNNFEEKVGILKMHPWVSEKELEFYWKEKYSGLIIEATGLGHTPIREDDSFVWAIKRLVDSGCVVGITSQCLYGRVNPLVYTNLRKVQSTGAIYCEDMLPETALMKLSWLLGNFGKEKAKELLAKNLRGEISEFTAYEP